MSSAQTMKIYSIISRIEQVLNDSPKYKLSGGNRKIVEVGELFDLLGDLKVTIPEDIRRASGIIAEEGNILGDANEQAEEIVSKAKADAEDLMKQAQEAAEKVYNQSVQEYEALVSEESVYREAAERAQQIQQEAIDNANAITNGSRQYADDMLADVQRYLNDYIKMLNTNREELNGKAAPEYEEKDVEKEVSEQRALEERHEVTAAPSVPARPAAEPEDEEEEEEPVRPVRKEPKKAAKPAFDDEEDDEPKKPRKKGWFKRMLEGDDTTGARTTRT